MTTVYRDANVFDAVDGEVHQVSFRVEDDRITAMGLASSVDTEDAETVDLSGRYVMPGLFNVHSHMFMDPINNRLDHLTETEATLNAVHNLRDLLHSGVTTVRECGDPFDVDVKIKRYAQSNADFEAPRIVASGRPMSMTGGHGDFVEGPNGELGNFSHLVDSPDEMRKAVRTAFRNGADGIKMMATGGVMSPGDRVNDTALTVEEMRAGVEEAHHKGRKVAAHAQGNAGIQNALDAGVDSIEHGIYIDESQAEFMARNGVFLVPTLCATWGISERGRGIVPAFMEKKNDQVQADFFRNMRMAHDKGVTFAVGTDAGTPFNDFATGTCEEMWLLVEKAGLSIVEALLAGTANAARLLGVDDDRGTLQVGRRADFLVLDSDPTRDIRAVAQQDKAVVKGGRLFYGKL